MFRSRLWLRSLGAMKDLPVLVARVVLTLVFGSSALVKLFLYQRSRSHLSEYEILGRWSRSVLAAIIGIEGTLSVALFTGVVRQPTAVCAIALLSTFTIAMVASLLRGRSDRHCGCMVFGFNPKLGWSVIARNGALILLAVGIATTDYAIHCESAAALLLALAWAAFAFSRRRNTIASA